VVEGAPLLREYTGNGIEGSNPFFSATYRLGLLVQFDAVRHTDEAPLAAASCFPGF
jgi:hypothetical protein